SADGPAATLPLTRPASGNLAPTGASAGYSRRRASTARERTTTASARVPTASSAIRCDPRQAAKAPASGQRQRVVAEHRHVRHAVAADPAAVHALGIEREGNAAVRAQRDRAAVATGGGNVAVDHRLGGPGQGRAGQAHARAYFVRRGGADVELAPAGARHRAARVGPGAGADDRRVADAAVALVGHAAGGRARGEP